MGKQREGSKEVILLTSSEKMIPETKQLITIMQIHNGSLDAAINWASDRAEINALHH